MNLGLSRHSRARLNQIDAIHLYDRADTEAAIGARPTLPGI
jgi:hypothetical protein